MAIFYMAIPFVFCIKEYSKAGPGEYYKLFTYSYGMLLLHPARFVLVNKRETATYTIAARINFQLGGLPAPLRVH